MGKITIYNKPLIDEGRLIQDIKKQNIRKMIDRRVMKAAQDFVDSFHGEEVYTWKEDQHRPDFLTELFVNILGYKKTNSINRGRYVTFATEYKDNTGTIPDGILGFFSANDLNTESIVYPDAFIEVEDTSYSFGEKRSDRGRGVDQVFDYAAKFLNPNHHKRFEIVTNFVELRIYSENRIESESINLRKLNDIRQLEKLFYFLAPQSIVPELNQNKKSEPPISILQNRVQKELQLGLRVSSEKASEMGKIHEQLVNLNFTQDQADKMIVRLAFLMFADDTGIFNKENEFTHYLQSLLETPERLRLANLAQFFTAVDTQDEEKRYNLYPGAPYIDGGLFRNAEQTMGFVQKPLPNNLINSLIDISEDDWSKVNPIVFGSMYEGAIKKKTRREIGAHYTSENNILKVINKLFMNDLRSEFNSIKNSSNSVVSRLLNFKKQLSNLTFLDPACGSGNFLILSYRELRRLEHEVISEILQQTDQNIELGFGMNDLTEFGFNKNGTISSDKSQKTWQPLIGVDVNQFSGLEIGIPYEENNQIRYNHFPIDIARAGMWMMDHLMNIEFSNNIASGIPYIRIPLRKSANIKRADALTADWNSVVNVRKLNYVLGNPPFIGAKTKKGKAKRDKLSLLFPDVKNVDNMDYVFGWYLKCIQIMNHINPQLKAGFVSVNSLTQGSQALTLKRVMEQNNIEIDFANQSFKWDNNGAQVFVVIIGFNKAHALTSHNLKHLTTTNNGEELQVSAINQYLLPGKWLNVDQIHTNSSLPSMKLGSLFLDNDKYRISIKEYDKIKANYPELLDYLHPFFGAKELMQSVQPLQYVFYFPNQILPEHCPAWLQSRIQDVKKYRKTVSDEDKKLSDVPLKYKRDRYYGKDFLAIPRHSADIKSRPILPMRYMDKQTMISDGVYQVPNCPLWLFVILQSKVHYVWLTLVSGTLGNSLRYSSTISYSKFPLPVISNRDKKQLIELGKQLNEERTYLFKEGNTLSTMYVNGSLPNNLNRIHKKIDSLVDELYHVKGEPNNYSRLAAILKLVI
ncbi:DNA methyltransferase [uncultured Limosilactobacillus sp.]|uniref:DNA methyltransferase n=1 Tax=uncultured Limosilactobacillus sp. TaxID=2837629 RepID=UPI0025CD43EF|nr:DNA methyltransferase [uncultured Limosilactobacillus sp.]